MLVSIRWRCCWCFRRLTVAATELACPAFWRRRSGRGSFAAMTEDECRPRWSGPRRNATARMLYARRPGSGCTHPLLAARRRLVDGRVLAVVDTALRGRRNEGGGDASQCDAAARAAGCRRHRVVARDPARPRDRPCRGLAVQPRRHRSDAARHRTFQNLPIHMWRCRVICDGGGQRRASGEASMTHSSRRQRPSHSAIWRIVGRQLHW